VVGASSKPMASTSSISHETKEEAEAAEAE
jgi:hypothetical protein